MSANNEIVAVAIYPAIGIARVGNSPTAFFFGPEIPGPHPTDPDNFRDPAGGIKRQAQRFRLYGLNAAGQVVKEMTAQDGAITWTVHVANKKAAWYDFKVALDIPVAQPLALDRRNKEITNKERSHLVIDPGPRSISGTAVNATGGNPQYAFNTGKFFGKPVDLGELRTDEGGRLIFLGGYGIAAASQGEPLTTYANNKGWYDDTADGPVEATLRLADGRVLTATGAWIIVGPPNYAPGVPAIVTGYDLLLEVATKLDPMLKPARPTFYQQIYPLLQRLTLHQWVNGGFAQDFGWRSREDFTHANVIVRLNNPNVSNQPLREDLFARFRNPAYTTNEPDAIPQVYGDGALNPNAPNDPREWMAVLPLQYKWLAQWAAGDFIADAPPPPLTWQTMSPAAQAQGLTQAALEETTGGPFHPGCEFTWTLRQPMLYSAPFRLKRRSQPERDYGATLTPAQAFSAGGPLDGSAAGDITRWMAVPWQTDTASCLSDYFRLDDRPANDYVPTFWPARVPNDVLTAGNYRILIDPQRTAEEKKTALGVPARRKWLRKIAYEPTNDSHPLPIEKEKRLNGFLQKWAEVAIIAQLPIPDQGGLLPFTVWAETGRTV